MSGKQSKEYYRKHWQKKRTKALRKLWLDNHKPRLSIINSGIFLWGY